MVPGLCYVNYVNSVIPEIIFESYNMFLFVKNYFKEIALVNHTLTGHFFRYTLLVKSFAFCIQNSHNSLWQSFNKVLETLIRDFNPH